MKVRLETMSKCHCLVFLLLLFTSIAMFFVASFTNVKSMLIYDEGQDITCLWEVTDKSN